MAITHFNSNKVHVSEIQVLYPDQKVFDHKEFTPGTIIELDGYALTNGLNHNGEKAEYLKDATVTARLIGHDDVRPPLRCTVRKVITAITENGTYFIVETDVEYSKKEQEILRRKYHSFGLGHINRIIHKEPASILYEVQLTTFCNVQNTLVNMLQTIDPHHCFNLREIVNKGIKDRVFFQSRISNWPFTETKFSKKRLASWLKQNINRFKQKEYLLKF